MNRGIIVRPLHTEAATMAKFIVFVVRRTCYAFPEVPYWTINWALLAV